MSFFLRPYRTIPGPDFDENRADLEFLAEAGRKMVPIVNEEGEGYEGFKPRHTGDLFFPDSDAEYLPDFEEAIVVAGRRVVDQVGRILGWDTRLIPESFKQIFWTFFHSDLSRFDPKHSMMVDQLHVDRTHTFFPRALWLSQENSAGLRLVCPRDQEGVAYCTNCDDWDKLEAFATLPQNRIVVVRGNTIVETTDDMIHCREKMVLPNPELAQQQFAMRLQWPG